MSHNPHEIRRRRRARFLVAVAAVRGAVSGAVRSIVDTLLELL